MLIVAGKFDRAKAAQRRSQRVFGAIPRPTRALPDPYTQEPTQDGEREVTLRRTGGQQVLIESFHIPADAQADSAAIGLLAEMLNERPAGRLYKDLIETKLAVQANANAASLHDPGYLMFSVVLTKDGDLPAARAALDKLIAGLATEPFKEEELQRVKSQELNGYERLMSNSRAGRLRSERERRRGRLASAVLGSRPDEEGDDRGRAARGEHLPHPFQPDRRRVHSRRKAAAGRDSVGPAADGHAARLHG